MDSVCKLWSRPSDAGSAPEILVSARPSTTRLESLENDSGISPPRSRLPPARSDSSSRSSPSDAGSSPERRLSKSRRSLSDAARLPSDAGIGPESWLELSASDAMAVAFPSEAGMGPESELPLRSSTARRRHRWRSSGTPPVRLASETTSDASDGSAGQMPGGSGAARCTDWNVTEVTLPVAASQPTCDHLHGDDADGDQSGGRAAVVLSHCVRKATSDEAEAAVEEEKERRWSKRRRRKCMGLGNNGGNGSCIKNRAVLAWGSAQYTMLTKLAWFKRGDDLYELHSHSSLTHHGSRVKTNTLFLSLSLSL
ncbi:hypothetical protein EE612_022081 [Oryza sativa]|nr:hypothetical protein EE612_022081 [Oryza sativa]